MRLADAHPARGLLAAALFAIAPAAARGQATCSGDAGAPPDSGAVPIVIVAHVHADAVVFGADPDTRVLVNGCAPTGDQVRYTSNLPDPVEPGVRYTNVEVSAEYRVWLNVECRAPDDAAAALCDAIGAAANDSTDAPVPESRPEPPADGRRD